MSSVIILQLSEINIKKDRFRKNCSEDLIAKLQDSIGKYPGLLSAPGVKELPSGDYELVFGETRLRAIEGMHDLGQAVFYNGRELEEGEIPVLVLVGGLGELELLTAELEENTLREGFTFLEESAAIARIAALQQKLLDINTPLDSEKEESVKISNEAIKLTTAQIFEGAADSNHTKQVKLAVVVAKAVTEGGALGNLLAGATNANEANKIIQKHKESEQRVVLANAQGKTFSSDKHTVLHGDCLEEMKKITARFDVCLTDPIYGIGANKFADGGGKIKGSSHDYDDSPETFRKVMPEALKLMTKLMKPAAHIYIACDIRNYFLIREYLEAASDKTNPWKIPNAPIIQYKLAGGRVPYPGYTFRRSWEMWIYAYRGDKQEYQLINDVIECVSDKTETIGAAKPVDLLKTFLRRSCMPGNTVLDFMAGSGGILKACHELKLLCTAIESSKEQYGRCLERIKELK